MKLKVGKYNFDEWTIVSTFIHRQDLSSYFYVVGYSRDIDEPTDQFIWKPTFGFTDIRPIYHQLYPNLNFQFGNEQKAMEHMDQFLIQLSTMSNFI